MLKLFLLTSLGVTLIAAAPAHANSPNAPTAAPVQYIDFPASIDPKGSHKHIALARGSRLYARPQIVIHQIVTDPQGRSVDDAYVVDADAVISHSATETLVVEPDGTKWHLSPSARVDSAVQAWNYIVVKRAHPVPTFLRTKKPDIEIQ